MISFTDADVNGVRLHCASAGAGEPVLLLHGFPDFWYLWRTLLPRLGRSRLAVAPDMRGYNRSSKPPRIEDYRLATLAGDIAALIDRLGGRAAVVGHDWGGVVAWELAARHPERVGRLAIVNAPHPAIFRRELTHNPAQRAASGYIERLCAHGAAAALAADDYAILAQLVIGPGLERGYFSEADAAAYRDAWAQPGALEGMLNYYRANNFAPDRAPDRASAPAEMATSQPIAVPTLVIWGEDDPVLLPGCLNGLDAVAADLRIVRVPRASHAIVHERPELLAELLEDFL